ncbi:MAG: hypothetical protein FAZ92_01398 [Accumulibacter sp.]|nr:MAG: hypothetical protein FAZ92_01398 [Accumulibacter sp.]
MTAAMNTFPDGKRRQRVRAWVEQPRVQNGIIGLILVNAALLGLETSSSAMAAAGGLIVLLDRAILAVFVGEIALRLYAHRAAFWRDPWSVFDFAVVAIALLPATGPLAVLRALRVLRVLRLLTMVPSMRRVVGALLAAIPGLGSIAMVLLIAYIIVNAMQSYTEAEQRDTKRAVEAAREHIEADLHAEMRSLRDEIRVLKSLLSGNASNPPALAPDRTASERR